MKEFEGNSCRLSIIWHDYIEGGGIKAWEVASASSVVHFYATKRRRFSSKNVQELSLFPWLKC